MENFDQFDEWLAFCQSFPYKPLSLNVSPLKHTINLSKFFPTNLHPSFETHDQVVEVFSCQTVVLYTVCEELLATWLW